MVLGFWSLAFEAARFEGRRPKAKAKGQANVSSQSRRYSLVDQEDA